ncbi:hypothetical protein DPMN_054175 [Dreissena polymorpha]|uniref:Uncharacterized protein n=1 Tax=Dreissena polymorpha TaxID=45954 RepID=A0A9D4CMQ5_DREPO|nr:hypothetical protein DPMN_054175 [Dreissena polymorpha]
MKCPKQDGGSEGTGKFCHKCGAKRITEEEILLSKPAVIICSGTDEGGKPCGSPLRADQTFCENCGANVVALVTRSSCGTCGSVITTGSTCLKCKSIVNQDTLVPHESSQEGERSPIPSKPTPEKDYSRNYSLKDYPDSFISENKDPKRTIENQSTTEDKQVLHESVNQEPQNNIENVPGFAANIQSLVIETGRNFTNETQANVTETHKLDMFNIKPCLGKNGKPMTGIDKKSDDDPVTNFVAKEIQRTNIQRTHFHSDIDTCMDDTTHTTQNYGINPVSIISTDKMGVSETSTDPANYRKDLPNEMPCYTSNDCNQDAPNDEKVMVVSNTDGLDNGSNINEKTNEVHEPMLESDYEAGSRVDFIDGSESDDCENNEYLAPEVNAQNVTALPRATKTKNKGNSSTKERNRNKREKKRTKNDKQSALDENLSKVFGSVNEGHSSNVDTGKSEETFTSERPSFFPSHITVKANTKGDKDPKNLNAMSSDQKMESMKNENERPTQKGNCQSTAPNVSTTTTPKQNTTKQSSDVLHVVFHVRIPDDILDTSDFDVAIVFGSAELGGWNNMTHTMSKMSKKGCQGKYVECILDIYLHKYLLQKTIQYKYCFAIRHKEDPQKNEYVWEHYRDRNKGHGLDQNRKFFIDKHMLPMDDLAWHQYDGVAVPVADEGVFKRIGRAFKNSFTGENTKAAIGICKEFFWDFLPPLFKAPIIKDVDLPTIEDEIEQVKMLMNGLRKVYVVDYQCWRSAVDFKDEVR